jgi:hypothetical protein
MGRHGSGAKRIARPPDLDPHATNGSAKAAIFSPQIECAREFG